MPKKPFVRHILNTDCFYRRQEDDYSITKKEPTEGYIYSVVETTNKKWFYERLDKLNNSEYSYDSPYVKHTLRYKCFYRIPNDDTSMILSKPRDGYFKRKEEDLENEGWFNERWNMLNNSEFTPTSKYVKHTLKDNCFYRKSGDDDSMILVKPREGYYKRKEEDLENEGWFNEKLLKLQCSILAKKRY